MKATVILIGILLSCMGGTYATASTPQQKEENAIEIGKIQSRANAGDAEAQYRLGEFYRKGIIPGILETPDEKEATRWYMKAAQNGSANGMVALAGSYLFGMGICPKDMKKAVEWYKKAAKKGNAYAYYALGRSEQEGWVNSPNPKKAFEYYKIASDKGRIEAQNSLAICHYFGIGTYKNYPEAFRLWKISAEAGNPAAFNNLARCFILGIGTPKDREKGLEWFEKAAEAGNPAIQFFLGELYYNGTSDFIDSAELKNVPVDYVKSAKNLERFLGQQNMPKDSRSQALRTLSACYLFGRGVEKDESRANALIEEAAALGDPDAMIIKEVLNSIMNF